MYFADKAAGETGILVYGWWECKIAQPYGRELSNITSWKNFEIPSKVYWWKYDMRDIHDSISETENLMSVHREVVKRNYDATTQDQLCNNRNEWGISVCGKKNSSGYTVKWKEKRVGRNLFYVTFWLRGQGSNKDICKYL